MDTIRSGDPVLIDDCAPDLHADENSDPLIALLVRVLESQRLTEEGPVR